MELVLAALATGAFLYIKYPKLRIWPRRKTTTLTPPGAALPTNTTTWNWFKFCRDMSTHLLIVGKTESGKSHLTTALIILRSYIGKVIIISPIAKPQSFGGLGHYAVGKGENVAAIQRAFLAVLDERARRAKIFAETGEDFEPLTIVVDEVPWLYENMEAEIENFMKNIGSSGRHYNLRGIFLTQSNLIKDIGGSTSFQENFITIFLGKRARLLAKEKLKKPEIFNGVNYPALLDDDGELKIIKLDKIPHIFNGGKFSLDGKLYAGFRMDSLWRTPADFESSSVVPAEQFERGTTERRNGNEAERIRELADQGLKPYEIAKKLGGRYQSKLEKVKQILEVE